jgi:hypothetical protein
VEESINLCPAKSAFLAKISPIQAKKPHLAFGLRIAHAWSEYSGDYVFGALCLHWTRRHWLTPKTALFQLKTEE